MRIFQPKKQSGKLMIPVGLNELSVIGVDEKLTANKKMMVVLTIAKAKGQFWDDNYERASYNRITCYHVESPYGKGSIGEEWFKPFTASMPEATLQTFKKRFGNKPKFLALVGQRQRPIMHGNALALDGAGRQIYMWESYIHSVFRLGTDVRITMDGYKELFSYERWPESLFQASGQNEQEVEEEVPF